VLTSPLMKSWRLLWPLSNSAPCRGFAGTPEELDTLLAEGLASKELTEDEFWGSVNKQTDAMLAEHKAGPRS
jgi:hypothetical protein